MIKITHFNETYVKVICDDFGIEMEISEYFTFFAPGYKYHPKFRSGMWDGRIKLYNTRTKTIYKGLLAEVIKFANKNSYEIVADFATSNSLSLDAKTIEKYVLELNLHGNGKPIDVRTYQHEAIFEAVDKKRSLLLSPTSSGKSAIIYSAMRWHIDKGNRVLIVVPTTMLVNQLYSDFADYSSANGWQVDDHITMIYSGKERLFEKDVVISTWQSIVAMEKNDKEKFKELVERTDTMMLDECLHPNSHITTINGLVKIKDISVGDIVLTINEATGNFEYKPVLKVHKNISNEKMYKVKLKNGKELLITGNHKVNTTDGWKRTDQLVTGDSVVFDDSNSSIVFG